MRVVHVSYAVVNSFTNPVKWLNRIGFFTGLPEQMGKSAEVHSLHCIGVEGQLRRNHVCYHFLKLSYWNKITGIRVSRRVTALQPDAVIIHGLAYPLQVVLLLRMLNRNVSVWYQHHAEPPLRWHKAFLHRWIDQRITGYFFSSTILALPWIKKKQIESLSKVHELMEISSDLFQATDIEEGEDINDRNRNYLWVGRLDENKDPLTLVSAFRKFLVSDSNIRLHLIYRGGNLARIENLLDETVKEKIIVVQDVSHRDLVHWYKRCGFIISTSHYESGGAAVCEGMSFGCVPIVSDIPAFRTMTASGQVGLLFQAGNPDDLLAALRKTVTLNLAAEQRKVLLHFQEQLSFEALGNRMLTILKM